MLINFCDERLRTNVNSETTTTEGHEVVNLISNNCDRGFLAYASIRPPVNVDFTFVCNVKIHKIIIWPSVGAQRSSGLKIFSKPTNDDNVPFSMIATCFLNGNERGVVFNRRDVATDNKCDSCVNFHRRTMRITERRAVDYCNSLRISIVKTDNSVPALGRVEIWGSVSSLCGRDVFAAVHLLLMHNNDCQETRKLPIVDDQTSREKS